jgi:hypothetical protein
MPFNLKVTNWHESKTAIDFAPIGLANNSADYVRYTAGYLQLLQHMRFGWLRINAAKTCRHYHYEIRDGVNWGGYEITSYNDKKKTCVYMDGSATKIDLGKYGASERIQELIDILQAKYAAPGLSDVGNVFDLMRQYVSGQLLTKDEIVFDPGLIPREKVQLFADIFTSENTYSVQEMILPGSYATQQEFFQASKSWLYIVAVGLVMYFGFKLLPKSDSPGKISQPL